MERLNDLREWLKARAPYTRLILSYPGIEVSIVVKGLGPKRKRRAFALAIFRSIKGELRNAIQAARIHPSDYDAWNSYRDEKRGVSLSPAVDLSSRHGGSGFALRLRRYDLGLTLEQLAELSGVSLSHLSEIERGRHMPRTKTLERLNRALDQYENELSKPEILKSETISRNGHKSELNDSRGTLKEN